jgi:hypothetical protein
MASLAVPSAPGAIGSHGHSSQAAAADPAIATAMIAPVSLAMSESRRPRRSRLSDRPAMSAMNMVAIPEMS